MTALDAAKLIEVRDRYFVGGVETTADPREESLKDLCDLLKAHPECSSSQVRNRDDNGIEITLAFICPDPECPQPHADSSRSLLVSGPKEVIAELQKFIKELL